MFHDAVLSVFVSYLPRYLTLYLSGMT